MQVQSSLNVKGSDRVRSHERSDSVSDVGSGYLEMNESDSSENWSVEKEYQSRMAALTPKERVARSVAMFNMTRESIGRQVIDELGEMSYDRLRWEVALRMYSSEPAVCEMIRERLEALDQIDG